MTSLIITDDEANLVESLSELLKSNGIDVVGTAKNGKEAVELCTKFNPDFLLMDLSMPEYDGFYAIDKLQEMKNPVKIIIMTGLSSIETEEKLIPNSYVSYLTKPMSLDALLEVLK